MHIVDASTIQWVARCMALANHRRRKAAAKYRVRLDLQSFQSHFAIVDTARQHDNLRARELCAAVKRSEIYIFNKAYVDFEQLAELAAGDVIWVTRAKDNLQFRVVRKLQPAADGNILADQYKNISSNWRTS